MDEGYQMRRGWERGHQPGRAYALHPGADVGCDQGDPNRAKDRPLERAPDRSAGTGACGFALPDPVARGGWRFHMHITSLYPTPVDWALLFTPCYGYIIYPCLVPPICDRGATCREPGVR